MAIVQDRLNAKKPPPQQTDPKTGKLATGAINNDKDLDVESKKDEPGFFNSFFAGTRSAQVKKKGAAAMDSVSYLPTSFLADQLILRTSHRRKFAHKQH